MTQAWLPKGEQQFYDGVVHGLRSRGWSRLDAESEALDRLETLRQQRKGEAIQYEGG